MRSFSTLFALVTLIATHGIQGVDAGATHDKLKTRASIHRRVNARNLKVDVPSTLVKKSKKRYCRARPSNATTTTGTTFSQNATDTSSPTADTSSPPAAATSSASNSTNTGSNTPVGNSDYRLDQAHQGSNFFDGWTFIDDPDYTHGAVLYQSREGATSKGLAYVDGNGYARMDVDTTANVDGNRPSIRIQDTYQFGMGTIVVMDAAHMPVGCGVWPAFWSNYGINWPVGGEIDIVEGVHNQVDNLSSLHTTGGCSASNDGSFTGTVGNVDCTSGADGNSGCNISNSNESNNYGDGFNSDGGGVYVMKMDDSGITMWFFPRNAIPSDITNEAPNPDSWGTPYANFPSSSCSMSDHFFSQTAIFDTTLCGDWAGATWESSGCAASTGSGSCEDFVANNGGSFSNAYWEVNYVKYFVHK